MPYSGPNDKDLPANVQGMNKDDRAQWVAVWNNSYAQCKQDGGETATCEGKAFSIANGVLKKKHAGRMTQGATMNSLQQLWETIKRAFSDAGFSIVRSVVDVENWDGAASNYSSTEAYCNACLINLNEGDSADWTQELCKLPVVKPGGSAYVRQAMHAAAQRMAQLKKPAGVPQEKWDAAKKKAARELISAYKEGDEVAPDVCYEMAGMTPPKRSLNQARAVPLMSIAAQVRDALEEMNKSAYKVDPETMATYIDFENYLQLFDLYYDNGDLIAVVTRGGKLFRIPVMVTDDTATLGEMTEIPLTRSAAQSQFRVIRTADGKRKWFAIACSSVLNRVNEIDSRKLFDSFVEHATRTGEYPVLSFYHAAEVLRWGVATLLARDGDLYIAAGEWDDTPEAQRAADAFEQSEKIWGTSIGYASTKPPEWLELEHNVRIPVFTEGVNSEISIVLEREAAAYLTAFSTEEVLVQKTDLAYRRLVELFGEEEAERQLAAVNGSQRVIEDTNPVRRATEEQAQAQAPAALESAAVPENAPAAVPAPARNNNSAPAETRTLELDDETLAALAAALAAQLKLSDLQTAFTAQADALAALMPRIEQMEQAAGTTATRVEERLAQLERADDAKQRAWLADLPAPQRTTIVMRPRETRAPKDDNGKPAPEITRGAPLY